MAFTMIVDPSASSRTSINHQLSQVHTGTILQLKSFDEAKQRLSSEGRNQEGLVIVSLAEGLVALKDFVKLLRGHSQKICIIATMESISLEEMRALVGSGVDQILLRPFNAKQLKDKITAAEAFRKQALSEITASPKDKSFQVRIDQVTPSLFRVGIVGWLTENCDLMDLQPETKDATLFIDCDHMKGVNSVGIRSWVLWMMSLTNSGFKYFEFENVHHVILRQAGLVQGFIPSTAVVNSFYLFYYNEELDEETEFKFSRGQNFDNENMQIPKTIEVLRDGKKLTYELSENVQGLLKFYKGKIELKES